MRAARTTLSSLAAMSVTLTAWGARPTGSEPTEPATTPSASDAPPSEGSTFSVVAALAELPADLVDEAPLITMADVAAASEAADLPAPDPSTSDDFRTDFAEWVMTISGRRSPTPPDSEPDWAPIVITPPPSVTDNGAAVEDLAAAVGFTFADVEWFADVSYLPGSFSVLGGAFDASTLSPDLVPVADGIVTLGEGDDFSQDFDNETPLSRIGVPQRLAYRDGRIAISPDTAQVGDWLAGTADAPEVDDDLLAAATALDEVGVSSAALGSMSDFHDALGEDVSEAQLEAMLASFGDSILDDQFEDAVGLGWNVVDGEGVMTVVYVLDDAADAEAATENVRRMFTDGQSLLTAEPISDHLTLDEVTSDGRTVVATVRPAEDSRPGILRDMLVRHDLPFVTLDD